MQQISKTAPQGREQLAAERRQWQAIDDALRSVWSLLAARTVPDPLPEGH